MNTTKFSRGDAPGYGDYGRWPNELPQGSWQFGGWNA
jgi:hypothetical protein